MEANREMDLTGSCSSCCRLQTRVRVWLSMLRQFGANWWLDSLFALVSFVALLSMPGTVCNPDLDSSWQQALQECLKNRAQAGSDYIFTFGPLGGFLTPIYAEEVYWHKYAWELTINLAIVAIVTLLGRRILHKGDRLLFYALWLVYVIPVYDLRFIVSSLALAILFLVSPPRMAAFVLAGVYLAILCLGKFTHSIFVVPALLLVTTWKWWETGRRTVLALPLAFVASVIGFWLAAGQALSNLPKFAAMSLEIASGYVDAMSLAGPRSSLFMALAIFGLDVLLALAAVLYTRERARYLVGLALIFAALHLEFRHGLIRHDLHCLFFFGFAMTVPFLLSVLEPILATRWRSRLGLGFTLLLAAQGFQQADGVRAPDLPRRVLTLYRILRTNVREMRHPCAHQEALRDLERQHRETYPLPKIKARVGSESIDMVSCLQAMLFLNGLHWTPRPVFQSYSAYTPKLLSVNEDFYKSSGAPRFVLFHLDAIDGRFPTTEDSGVLFKLLQHYRPVMKEKGYLLLEQWQKPGGANPPAPLETCERTAHFGELVTIPPMKGTYLTAAIHFHPRTSSKLLHVLYRNPMLYLNICLSDGSLRQYRLIPGMTAQEFLLNPLVEDSDDFLGLYCGKSAKRIVCLSVTQEDFYGLRPYDSEIGLTLKSYPTSFIQQISPEEGASFFYAALGAIPLRAKGVRPE